VNTQREYKKLGKLKDERIHRLEDLGVIFGNLSKHKWEKMFALLVQYTDREGHCRVLKNHKEDDENLGFWLSHQRLKMKNGKLSDDYQCQLEEIGVVWKIRDVRSAKRWEEMYGLLMQFNEREGHCRVPLLHKEDDENLGTWLTTQRTAKSKEKLSSERRIQLEEIGVELEMRGVISAKKWEKMYELLMQFNEREGHCRVPQNHKEDDANLGKWLDNQRTSNKKGKLSEERRCHLEECGVVLDPSSRQ